MVEPQSHELVIPGSNPGGAIETLTGQFDSKLNCKLSGFLELLETEPWTKRELQAIRNKSGELLQDSLLNDFEKFVALRNIFAHVPINTFSKELEFNDKFPYNNFFKRYLNVGNSENAEGRIL